VTDARPWIGLLSFTCAAAGVGVGVLVARWTAPPPPVEAAGAFPDYERLLAERFELSPARREVLRVVLESYDADVDRIKDRHMADYMNSIEPELRERGRYYRDLIRDRVLPQEARATFDRLSLGIPATRND
jgi:hypothetical protein